MNARSAGTRFRSRHGVDEHGVRFPLFFRAFGEDKNPTYIYVLAAVLKVTGPSNLAARRLSAFLGWGVSSSDG